MYKINRSIYIGPSEISEIYLEIMPDDSSGGNVPYIYNKSFSSYFPNDKAFNIVNPMQVAITIASKNDERLAHFLLKEEIIVEGNKNSMKLSFDGHINPDYELGKTLDFKKHFNHPLLRSEVCRIKTEMWTTASAQFLEYLREIEAFKNTYKRVAKSLVP